MRLRTRDMARQGRARVLARRGAWITPIGVDEP
jgi:hypothetical protein